MPESASPAPDKKPAPGKKSATPSTSAAPAAPISFDWSKPAAMAMPKEGYFKLEQGRYGPIYPQTPANYGFTIIAKVLPGREQFVRDYAKQIEEAVAGGPARARAAEAALPEVGAVRRRAATPLHVPGHLRHGLRQVHRGRRRSVRQDRASPPCSINLEGCPSRLEDQPRPPSSSSSASTSARASWSTASTRTSAPTRSRRRWRSRMRPDRRCSTRCSSERAHHARTRRHPTHRARRARPR